MIFKEIWICSLLTNIDTTGFNYLCFSWPRPKSVSLSRRKITFIAKSNKCQLSSGVFEFDFNMLR